MRLIDALYFDNFFSWSWSDELGSALAEAGTRTSKTVTGVELAAGSTVELFDGADGGEPLQIEALDVEPLRSSETISGALAPVKIEADAATVLQNARIRTLAPASEGMVLQVADQSAPMRAAFNFDGQSGRFDISVDYFDENDGRSQTTLRVDGRDVGTWTWDAEFGDRLASAKTLTSKTFTGVQLTGDSVVELVGRANGEEPLRVDALRFAPPDPEPAKPAMAFAGAQGFGSDTAGGRGGAVVHVTNLADSGVGSLRWALENVTGPRTVVFDLEGRIALKNEITIDDPFLTIAGQTAPGKGIVVSGARISIETHDIIMRGMKVRAGDGPGDIPRDRDNLAIGGNGDKGVENVIVDHNSFSWSVDESVSVWGSVRDVTVSNNIIAEALNDSIHVDEGKTTAAPHSMGMIVGHAGGDPNSENVTIAKNLFVSNMYRNAFIKGADQVEFTNNYVVNFGFGHSGLQLGGGDTAMTAAVIGNVYQDGRDTSQDPRPAFDLRSLNNGSKIYLKDNFVDGHRESASQPEADAAHGRLSMLSAVKFFEQSGLTALASSNVPSEVLNNAGARLGSSGLDVVDQRIVAGVKNGTAKIIDSPEEVGGYGAYKFAGAKVVDTDRDGMPDWFESAHASYGFDERKADDKLDYDKDGYTNIEEYINGRIDGFDLLA